MADSSNSFKNLIRSSKCYLKYFIMDFSVNRSKSKIGYPRPEEAALFL